MALPFNPFDKPKPKSGDQPQKKYTKVRVFDRADFELEPEKITETSNSKITSNNNITSISIITSTPKITSIKSVTSNHQITGNTEVTSNNLITSNSKATSSQTSNQKLVTDELPAKTSNYISNQLVTEIPYPTHFLTLSGLQRKIVALVFNLVKSKPDLTTDPISIEHFSDLLGRERNRNEIEVLKKTIIKLQHKGFIEKKSFKVGRGGHTSYALNATIFYQCSQTFGLETSNQLVTQSVTTPVISGPSKKVSNFKDYTFLLTDELKNIGLNSRHLESIDRPEEEIEQILSHYTHSLKNNEVKSSSKLAVVLSVLKDPSKQWISEAYLKGIEEELRKNQERMQRLDEQRKQAAELDLREKFGDYIKKNPKFLEDVAAKHPFVKDNSSLVEKMAMEEFKNSFSDQTL